MTDYDFDDGGEWVGVVWAERCLAALFLFALLGLGVAACVVRGTPFR